MGWRDDTLPGSFRGVPFLIVNHSLTTGRRAVLHEFPQREENGSEDLGRRAGQYKLEVAVIGESYRQQRDALARALTTRGPGELIHPYLGSVQVQIDEVEISESTQEGGVARFRIGCHDAGQIVAPYSSERVETALDAELESIRTLVPEMPMSRENVRTLRKWVPGIQVSGTWQATLQGANEDELGQLAAVEVTETVRDLRRSLLGLAVYVLMTRALAATSAATAALAQDRLLDLSDALAADLGDAGYSVLEAVRRKVTLAVDALVTELPRRTTVTLTVATPVLLVAFRLYGGLGNEPTILDWNQVAHPGVIVGQIEVPND